MMNINFYLVIKFKFVQTLFHVFRCLSILIKCMYIIIISHAAKEGLECYTTLLIITKIKFTNNY